MCKIYKNRSCDLDTWTSDLGNNRDQCGVSQGMFTLVKASFFTLQMITLEKQSKKSARFIKKSAFQRRKFEKNHILVGRCDLAFSNRPTPSAFQTCALSQGMVCAKNGKRVQTEYKQ